MTEEERNKQLGHMEESLVFAFHALAGDALRRQVLQGLLVQRIRGELGLDPLPETEIAPDEVQRTLTSSAGTIFHDLLFATTMPRTPPISDDS